MRKLTFGVLFWALLLFAGDKPQVQVVPLQPLGEDFVVIHGDIEKAGEPFVMRIRELRGSFIPPHTHPVDEHITVLSGKVCLGTGPEFERAKMQCLGPGGYAFFPKGTMIFGEVPEPGTVQVHGIGPFHLMWKYPVESFASPNADKLFKYRARQRIKTKYGTGTIEKGWKSGPLIQYETRVGDELVMATESEVRPASTD